MLEGDAPSAAGICRMAAWISRNSSAEWMSCWAARSMRVPVVPGLKFAGGECQRGGEVGEKKGSGCLKLRVKAKQG